MNEIATQIIEDIFLSCLSDEQREKLKKISAKYDKKQNRKLYRDRFYRHANA